MHTLQLEDMGRTQRRRSLLRWGALGVIAAMLAAAVWFIVDPGGDRRITAYFSAAVGIYPDSDVRVVGVPIGSVDSVEPQGEKVRVELTIDGDVDLPADAKALVVTPSLVADRYVQLSPVYQGGPRLADGAEIPIERTVTPVEIDELFASLNDLTVALGPEGANSDGAVSDVLEQGAKTLDGNGKAWGESIRQLGEFARTLNGSKEEMFQTVDQLSKFTRMLATNDKQINEATEQLSEITKVLAEDRGDLAAALSELGGALDTVQGFIRDNRGLVQSNVDKLAGVAQMLGRQKDSLAEALDTAPNALTNLLETYNPATRTIDGRANLLEYSASGGGGSGGPALPLPRTGEFRPAGGE
ncbi:MCE family protein [Amycolatopsis aidingensis]|uniref:MCE family protein n=1 Tax=Amycolatopsis aidingensis TaxID=2842453 RepID=UPI001C0DC173|nr:MCE family protein [Amycolatopsis aidingensis]